MDGTMLTNLHVYDFAMSTIASGYPMLTERPQTWEVPYLDYKNPHEKRANVLAHTGMGEGHDNFLSGIVVSFDLTCSIKMWTEFERYHFAQIVSSQSTMHRLKWMDLDDSCVSYVDPVVLNRVKELQKEYSETGDEETRLKLLYSCPTGLKLTARVTTNYRQLKTMIAQRKNHALPEWRQFCGEILTLCPHSDWILGKEIKYAESNS